MQAILGHAGDFITVWKKTQETIKQSKREQAMWKVGGIKIERTRIWPFFAIPQIWQLVINDEPIISILHHIFDEGNLSYALISFI